MVTPAVSGFLRKLRAESILTEEQLQDARALRSGTRGSLLQCVVKLGHLSESRILELLSAHTRLPVSDLSRLQPDPALVAKIPYRVAREAGAVPLRREDGKVVVAMSDPTDVIARDDMSTHLEAPIVAALAAQSAIDQALASAYRPGETAVAELVERYRGAPGTLVLDVVAEPDAVPAEEAGAEKEAAAAPIIALVDLIFREAVERRASDIHVEPMESGLAVRYRIDGILRDVQSLPRAVRNAVTARIKILSSMDITITRRPQDARARLRLPDREVDLRISTIPTVYGEKVVIRVLDSANLKLDLGAIFSPGEKEHFESLIRRPQGMVLISGPTGSGKTTTLYSAVRSLLDRTRNVMTIEDPVEYRLPGLNQVEVHEKAGLTFAAALRSALRQDPNVILVGEIRDAETARIAFQASITGHMILSTVHALDSAASVARLFDLGVEPSILAEGLTGVVSQRLLRRLCPKCRESAPPTQRDLLAAPSLAGASLFAPHGCDACDWSGYRGRVAVYEILPVTAELAAKIVARSPENEIRAHARAAGVTSMFDSALKLARSGATSMDEVLRAVPRDAADSTRRCSACGDPLAADFRACPSCGAPAVIACTGCGRDLRPGWRFCAGCSTPVPPPVATRRPSTPPASPRAAAPGDVLVVDDDPASRLVVSSVVKRAGYATREASDSEAALREIVARRPLAVIADLRMPGVDGLELCRRLRARLETASLPFIMLTASQDVGTEAEALDVGADDYLKKPVVAATLLKRLRMALERKAAPVGSV